MSSLVSKLFPVAVFATMLAALYAVFMYVPTEREMGLVQRIFYFHVSSAICALVAFTIVFVASIQYLRSRLDKWDRLAVSCAELGVMFSIVVLITGPIWAKPIWGVFWRWEPRLTFMLITFMMYVAYLMTRAYAAGTAEQTRRFAAVLGIVSFVNVPMVHYSVNLWSADQQLHPREVTLAPEMLYARYICLVAFACLFAFLLKSRLDLERSSQAVQELRQRLDATADS